MFIKSEFDIQFHLPEATPMLAMLHVHPTLDPLLTTGDELRVEHLENEAITEIAVSDYLDVFGNRCSRFAAPAGRIRLSGCNTISTEAEPDLQPFSAQQTPVEHLPSEVLQFLLASRYCQVDLFGGVAQDLFGYTLPGW